MKVQLIANMSANGQLLLKSHAASLQSLPQEVAGMGFMKAVQSGNIILGRATYEMSVPIIRQSFPMLDVVVLTSQKIEGVHAVATAREAVAYLEAKGYETATVVGGTMTYNAFLSEGLADDIYMNLIPLFISDGGIIGPASGIVQYQLAECDTNGDIIQLHYTR